MANLSKQKREEFIAKIEALKQKKAIDDTDKLFLNDIINELNEKRYGLIWEKHSETVDEMMINNIPVFTEDADKKIVSEPELPYNFLLEGDNLHSLKLLEKTHKGKIDVIYIDPPYNTGNKDFVYEDKMIGTDDGYRHSKWLSFMNERLQIARDLLSDNAKHNGIFGMNIYHVPIIPILIMILLIGLLQIVLSCVLSSNLKKETLVERIRYQG